MIRRNMTFYHSDIALVSYFMTKPKGRPTFTDMIRTLIHEAITTNSSYDHDEFVSFMTNVYIPSLPTKEEQNEARTQLKQFIAKQTTASSPFTSSAMNTVKRFTTTKKDFSFYDIVTRDSFTANKRDFEVPYDNK